MTPDELSALCACRADRAKTLAGSYPESREALGFYARLAELQGRLASGDPADGWTELAELVRELGPELLVDAAVRLDAEAVGDAIDLYRSGTDRASPRSFFARALLQPDAARGRSRMNASEGCPRCGHPPQLGVLRPEADGTALFLACGLCFDEWPHPRGVCATCGGSIADSLSYYRAPELPQLEVQACDACRFYLHWVDVTREPRAVPDVDEIAALPLDVWARGRGYRKPRPNLIGI